jgi:hypothetical protein
VSDQSPKRNRPDPPHEADGSEENDRPTLNPPFDVAAFARAATSPSSPSQATTPPDPDSFPKDPETRPEQITLTNEIELERARFQSIKQTEPPRVPSSPPVLSMANANAPSDPSIPAQRVLSPTSIEAAVLGAIATGPDITERTIDDPIAEMGERFSLGDYSGALEISELVLAEDPSNLEAAECGENCRTVLESMYAARLAPLDRAPIVVVPATQMRWLSIDHRAGFVLSLIDGTSTVETILDVSGMPRLDALRILNELVQQKVVAFR